ncbi:FAD binding domain-containing protein [Suillus subalutaceus]|uniref:FAD binding domain-containing protein n=1 Tax=Suillus subalutaceus TaxID=48586 RepID=UPI001B884F0E|nr:FAD binding domain-containing protein [Suillus subalutaceus]KAG1848750.1 FAD binding domain-containing protein [Suillus subalutaceus]
MSTHYDCIVVGSGHAGCSAALAAVEAGCTSVLIVEKAPHDWVGGNGYFTAGAHRTVHGGLQDLLPIVRNVTPEQASKIDMDPYTVEDFIGDIKRLGQDKPDAKLVRSMVESSREAVEWLARIIGIPFILSFHRQAYEVNGRQKFWGGMALSTEDGGKGLIKAHMKALEKAGVEIWFESPAVRLRVEKGTITGLVVQTDGMELDLSASSVVLAAGGYESSSELRAKHLGSEWEKARVRGTPFNTGDGFAMAQAVGAKLVGDWAGCHSTCWDANAPADAGDRELSNQFTKSGYPLGIMVNIYGQRFVDEGQDFRNFTYAKFGRQILLQPEGCAFQVWGADMDPFLRKEEYGDEIVEKILAGNMEELADKLLEKGLKDKECFLKTVRDYNAAVQNHRAEHPTLGWDPTIKDGLSTQSTTVVLQLPKSNWALPIDQGPFLAVKVACGITFTFGGLAIDPDTAGVLSKETDTPIKGLFCTGEMVGGLFYNNYPGGSGLTAGAVFGRKAGGQAAKLTGKSVEYGVQEGF